MIGTNPYTLPNPFAINQNQFQPIINQPMMPAPQMEIQKVNGEESAKAFPIGPNSSVILLDMTNPLIWVITTDASGYKTVNPFTITPFIPEQPISASDIETKMADINARLEKIEERMNAYGKSNHGSPWKDKPGNANAGSNVRNCQGSQGSAGGNPAAGAE